MSGVIGAVLCKWSGGGVSDEDHGPENGLTDRRFLDARRNMVPGGVLKGHQGP